MTLYRNIIWFYKGLKEYTKSGYEAASKKFVEGDLDVDCTGKVYMITGANSGIGKCIAAAVAKRGGTVHMVCRNPQSAIAAKEELKADTKNDEIYVHFLDLSKPYNVCKFANEFVAKHEQLDVLVNNAGCMVAKSIDEDGIETNFATNTLAPFILTKLLFPLLEKSIQPRVVFVSSGGMLVQKLNKDDPQCLQMQPFDPTMAYAQHKRQQVVITEVFSGKCNPNSKQSKIFFSAMHPGWADTPAVRASMPEFYNKMKNRLRTAEEGADTAVWLAISPAAIKNENGQFFQDRVPVATHLPLAWTKTLFIENCEFIDILNNYLIQFNADKLSL